MRQFLVVIQGDVEPVIHNEYASDELQVETDRNRRRVNRDADGLFGLTMDTNGHPDMAWLNWTN